MHTESDAQARGLERLLAESQDLRAAGEIERALDLGPAILRACFAKEQGRPLDRGNAVTFTEKLFCRMLDVHERGCPVYSRLSDKLAVRAHVAARVGERYLVPLLWQGDDARTIPWASLPGTFVLKCNEGSGKGARLQQPLDRRSVEALATSWLRESYYWFRREFHYWPVPRRLIIEPCLDDGHVDGPLDYIFFCFHGVPRLIQVGSRSHTIHRFFTSDWEPVRLAYRERYEAPVLDRPRRLDEMLQLAACLSSGFDFVRVDLYDCLDGVRFGELTFTPRAGKLSFDPQEWDVRLGEYWCYERPPES
jgi:hypothetical protein